MGLESLIYAFGGEVGIGEDGILTCLIEPGSEGFNLPLPPALLLSPDPSLF
jgi:hypothetical protein